MNNYYKKHICKQCGKVFYGKGTLCRKHASQLSIYGKFLDSNPRSKKDPNEIIIHSDYAEVVTYDENNNPLFKFKIDIEDVLAVKPYKWYAIISKVNKDKASLTYLCSNKVGLYHRYITNAPKGITVDHINRDTFDNRKINLRLANQTDQNHNQGKRSDTNFDIKGITQHKDPHRKKRFMARFNKNKKVFRSPWYETYEEAVFARYLLEQLSDVEVMNGNMSQHISKLTDIQKQPIIKWFNNRFKNQV